MKKDKERISPEIEYIKDKTIINNKIMYLVCWKNQHDAIWEQAQDLQSFQSIVDSYEQKFNNSNPKNCIIKKKNKKKINNQPTSIKNINLRSANIQSALGLIEITSSSHEEDLFKVNQNNKQPIKTKIQYTEERYQQSDSQNQHQMVSKDFNDKISESDSLSHQAIQNEDSCANKQKEMNILIKQQQLQQNYSLANINYQKNKKNLDQQISIEQILQNKLQSISSNPTFNILNKNLNPQKQIQFKSSHNQTQKQVCKSQRQEGQIEQISQQVSKKCSNIEQEQQNQQQKGKQQQIRQSYNQQYSYEKIDIYLEDAERSRSHLEQNNNLICQNPKSIQENKNINYLPFIIQRNCRTNKQKFNSNSKEFQKLKIRKKKQSIKHMYKRIKKDVEINQHPRKKRKMSKQINLDQISDINRSNQKGSKQEIYFDSQIDQLKQKSQEQIQQAQKNSNKYQIQANNEFRNKKKSFNDQQQLIPIFDIYKNPPKIPKLIEVAIQTDPMPIETIPHTNKSIQKKKINIKSKKSTQNVLINQKSKNFSESQDKIFVVQNQDTQIILPPNSQCQQDMIYIDNDLNNVHSQRHLSKSFQWIRKIVGMKNMNNKVIVKAQTIENCKIFIEYEVLRKYNPTVLCKYYQQCLQITRTIDLY